MRTKSFLPCALGATFVFALGAAGVAAAESNRPTPEQHLAKLEQDWADSYLKRDPSFAQRITTNDFNFVDSSGVMMNKADYIKSIAGNTVFTAFTIDQIKVRLHGDAAVVTGVATINAKTGEKDESGKYAFTDIFVKQNGEWKAVSGQVTAIAKP